MPLRDRPDFRPWLDRIELAHHEMTKERPEPAPEACSGCGGELREDDSPCGVCLVCLAEQYGREQAEAAAYVGRVLTVALMCRPDTPPDVMRAAVEDVMDEYDCFADGRWSDVS